MDPSWGMLKADILEVVWVMTLVFAPSEVENCFQPRIWSWCADDILVLKNVVALGVMVKFANGTEMCFFEKCGQSY